MKNYLTAILLIALTINLSGQKIEYLPPPSEVPKEERGEYRKEIRKAIKGVKEAKKGSDEDLFYIPEIERVSLPMLSKNSNNNDSWPRQQYCPDNILQRISTECANRVNLVIDDTKTFEEHPLFNRSWFLPYSNYTSEPETAPYNDHGTHVTGIAVQYIEPLLENGTVKLKSNWNLASNGSGSFSSVAQMMNEQRPAEEASRENNTATVHNQSFGATIDPITVTENAYKLSVEAGTYFIAAAGNSGSYTKSYPASSIYTISVASIDQSGNRSPFSTKGDFVDIAAGGSYVVAPVPDGGVEPKSGTSMAAPAVAAAATIALSKWGIEKIPDNFALSNYLMVCATDIPPEGYDDETGWGVAFIEKILDTDPTGDSSPPPPQPPTLETYQMTISLENAVMRWSESTTIGGELRVLSVPFIECSCETAAQSLTEARLACGDYLSGYFVNRAIMGVKNPNQATKYTGRFLELVGANEGFKIKVNRTEGIDEKKLNYIHHHWVGTNEALGNINSIIIK